MNKTRSTTSKKPQSAGFDGRPNLSHDDRIESLLGEFFVKHGIDHRLILRNFSLYARRIAIKRFLAHYELFRRTIELPGDIVELGVYRGTTLIQWANFLEARNIGDRTKRVIGFDNFYGFRKLDPKDGPEDPRAGKVPGGFDSRDLEAQLQEMIAIFDQDRFMGQKPRITVVKGDIEKTVPEFVSGHPGLRINLLHFDCDLYSPTKIGLEQLWDKVVPGGIVIFDEYGIEPWAGETQAVDEFFAERGLKPKLETFDWHAAPGAFVVK
jgi:hypothetical protein